MTEMLETLLQACIAFMKIGAFSFGGGFAVVGFIQREGGEGHAPATAGPSVAPFSDCGRGGRDGRLRTVPEPRRRPSGPSAWRRRISGFCGGRPC